MKEVLDALQGESLSSALEKLEAFAIAAGYAELAHWATTELNGYGGEDIPPYRCINVFWVNTQGNPIDLYHFSEEIYTSFTQFNMPRGVFELEPLSVKTTVFAHPNAANELRNIFTNRTGGCSPAIAGIALTTEMAETLFRRIRKEARLRVQKAIPTATATNTVRSMPDLTWMTDGELQTIVLSRWREADTAQRAGAPLATIILLGSILEGALLHKAESNMAKANAAAAAPKEMDNSGVQKVKRFSQWTLDNFITVAHEVGWLGKEIKDFSAVLRAYRNFVHPGEQKKQGLTPSSAVCDVCWPVVTAALADLARP